MSTDIATTQDRPWSLMPVASHDRPGLLAALHDLECELWTGASVRELADRALRRIGEQATPGHVLSLVGRGPDDLLREIEHARGGIARAFETEGGWTTPQGSSFTARPLGTTGGTALVYPGGFSSYLGQGCQLYRLFPNLADRVSTMLPESAVAVADRTIFPPGLDSMDAEALAKLERSLVNDTFAVVAAGASFAVATTLILCERLGLRPTATLGYSFGEATALWAHGVWAPLDGQRAEDDGRVARATRVLRPEVAAQELWGADPGASGDLWQSFVLLARPERVVEALAGETRAYLTIVTAPEEVVIAGDAAACQRVVERVGCRAARAPYNRVLHVEPLRAAYDAFLDLYQMPVQRRPDVAFYSASEYAPLRLDQESIAHGLARTLTHPLDFPRLVRRVYEDGASIFVEVGPGSVCSRWIRSALRDREHIALSLDQKGADGQASLIRVLATLLCHRVPLDLRALQRNAKRPGQHAELAALTTTLSMAPAPASDPAASVRQPVSAGGRAVTADTQRTVSSVPVTPATPAVSAPAAPVMVPRTVPEPRAQAWAFPLPDTAPAATAHLAVLRARFVGARQLRELLDLRVRRLQEAHPAPGGLKSNVLHPVDAPSASTGMAPPLIDEAGVREWATGSFEACFGPEYRIYDGRRAPRLPNGDLQLISRLVSLDGERMIVRPGAGLTAEFDVPSDPWYYQESAFPDIPYSILMELALQPCGFLSALLGSTLPYPELDFYFRNLDGRGRLLRSMDLRGRTIQAHVRLLSSTAIDGAIIQKFEYALCSSAEPLFVGDTTFGYFTADALTNQVGLDGRQTVSPWIGQHPESRRLELRPGAADSPWLARPAAERPHYRLAGQHFDLLDRFVVVEGGGRYGLGAVYADRRVRADDWFFACHFYQDPVMPGSLGVEAIIAAMQAFALRLDLGAQIRSPRFWLPLDHEVAWKYRGQILPTDDWLSLEVEMKRVDVSPDRITMVGDASLWRNRTRIYEVRDVAIWIVPSDERAG
jgi:PfaB family protein